MNSKLPGFAGLSAEELELLAYLLEEEGVDVVRQQTIFPRAQTAELPLSFAQERLWFLEQLDPGSPAYNIPFAVRIEGQLDIAALQGSLNEIVRRHENLRTTFATVEGKPVQIIAPRLQLELTLHDLSELPAAEREAEAHRLALHEGNQPFDFAHGPLIRTQLLRLAADEHVFLLTIHHIVFDGWSIGVFLKEMIAFYDAFTHDQAAALPEPPIQYADFAIWQRQWLQGEVLQQQIAYWKQQLRGPLPILQLPTDRPRPPVQTHRGKHLFTRYPRALADALLALAQREGATLFMVTLAAFQALLARYSGQDDIVVGSPIANRDFVELEGLMGFFVNTLPLRSNLAGDPSFRELIRRVRDMTLEAYAHQNIPFEHLVDEVRPERSLSHTPLFQVMFILQNMPLPAYERDDVRISFLKIDSGAAKFDLMLALTETPESLNVALEYNTDLFEEATVRRLLDHFRLVLEGVVANPDQQISRLPLLAAQERQQLLLDWQPAPLLRPSFTTLHDYVADQAACRPDAIAVVCGDVQLSYALCERRANQLAHSLRRLGVGPETRVALAIERSPELIISLLAVLKAGAAYVPLDPALPAERQAAVLADARPLVLISKRQAAPANPAIATFHHICVADWSCFAQEPTHAPASTLLPENPAYIIYTSGSTGTPKGVVITHAGLCSFVEGAQQTYHMKTSDRVLQFASISFDMSAEEIYSCLSSGATLVLRSDAMIESPTKFIASCVQLGITNLHLPTVYWHELMGFLNAEQARMLSTLRMVNIGGDRALPEPLAVWRAAIDPAVRLVNTYGPTETTINATIWDRADLPDPSAQLQTVPIGRPWLNCTVYVLDRYLQPVPVGVPGELYVGGPNLARGYLDRPDLTAERFVPNPFAASAESAAQLPVSSRLYKTGDLVRYQPDGTLEFIGRVDHQVKVRGFRIELGEIETVLASHPAVREVALVAREDRPGDTRLVAYIVADTSDDRDPTQPAISTQLQHALRSFLQERLPIYMVPAAFVFLETLPLSTQGKVDRQALPAPDWSLPLHDGFVAPRTALEEQIAAIWAAVLRLDQVGVHHNFFELGGHSLLATQVISRLQSSLHIDLPLRMLFEVPTVAGIAEYVETVSWLSHETPAAAGEMEYEEGNV